MTYLSLATLQFIMKKTLNIGMISARWVPHLLTNAQNNVLILLKNIKMLPEYDQSKLANVVTGDEPGLTILSQYIKKAIQYGQLEFANKT